jgi:hypothetical protein
MKKYVRWLWPILGVFACFTAYVALPRLYIRNELNRARAEGEYASPEEGLYALADRKYAPDHEVRVFLAGPNEPYGQKPYVWYVVAEVRASTYADGSEVGHNGCDNPGMFFIQLKDGKWVHVPEGILTMFMLEWLEPMDLVGEGETTPSTELLNGPTQFCR